MLCHDCGHRITNDHDYYRAVYHDCRGVRHLFFHKNCFDDYKSWGSFDLEDIRLITKEEK